jgi:hypothetical protein
MDIDLQGDLHHGQPTNDNDDVPVGLSAVG